MLEVTVVGRWALVVLIGELDVSNAAEIVSVAADLVVDGVAEVTVDLSRVTFIGAAAIDALVDADGLIAAGGGRVVLVGVSRLTQRVIDLTGGRTSLTVVPSPRLPTRPAHVDGREPRPVEPHPVEPGAGDRGSSVVDDELGRLLFEVSRVLLTESAVTGDLQAVVRTGVDLVPGCTGATVALVARSESHTAAVSDAIAVEVDLAQYVAGEGPCLLAAATATRIRVAASEIDGRFERFARLAAPLGVGAVLSVPVVVDDVTVGSVNLYSSTRFDSGAEAMGAVVAAQVAAALVKSEIYGAALALAEQVGDRTAAERNVHIAAGVLAGFEGCSLDQATRLLHAAADTSGDSLAAAAQRVIGYRADGGTNRS